MMHLFRLIFWLSLFIAFSCKHETKPSGTSSYTISSSVYFLICTDPIAHSYHRDYSSSDSYCNGLKYCIKRGYEVIRLPDKEAKRKRGDPCDFCYGR